MILDFSKVVLLAALAVALGAGCTDDPATPGGPGAAGASAAGTGSAAVSSAVAAITGFNGGTVTGTATFSKASATDVTVTVSLTNCIAGKAYPVHIHAGTSCADAMSQGDHWGPARGEGIPSVTCAGTTGTSTLTRAATDPTLAWTIGGDAATNVVGHAFVVHAPDVPMMPPRIGCGVIAMK